MNKTKVQIPMISKAHAQAMRADALVVLAQRATELAAQAAVLQEQVRLARGTRELAPAPPAPAPEPKSDLYRAVERLLREKPLTFRDLCAALRIGRENENSLKSILVRLQRDGQPVVNLGSGSRAIWWIDADRRIDQIAAGKSRVLAPRAARRTEIENG